MNKKMGVAEVVEISPFCGENLFIKDYPAQKPRSHKKGVR
jgi:hypothetical protein